MEIAGTGLFLVGLILYIIGWVMIVVLAFKESALWGIGSIFIPFVALVFVITHWQDARRGFFCSLGGAAVLVMGALITPSRQPKPVEQKPVPVTERNVAYVPPPTTYTPTPPKPKYVPPVEDAAQPVFAKVYADRGTHLYYPADCAKHPENALLIARSVAVMQGYKAAQCK